MYSFIKKLRLTVSLIFVVLLSIPMPTVAQEPSAADAKCVVDVERQMRSEDFVISSKHAGFKMDTGRAGSGGMIDHHVQGVIRLDSRINDNNQIFDRLLMTDTMSWDKDLPLATGGTANGNEGLAYFDIVGRSEIDNVFNPNGLVPRYRMSLAPDFEERHVGGGQGLGDYAVVAVEEQADPEGARIYVLQFPRDSVGRVINQINLDGGNGELHGPHRKALAAGITRLDNGQYLIAVPGSTDELTGIWFYVSLGRQLTENTTWSYVDHWERNCSAGSNGGRLNECFGGANNFGLVKQCGGRIYVIALNGGGGGGSGTDYHWLQLYEVTGIHEQDVNLELKHWLRHKLGVLASSKFSFRWGGGAYITDAGNIVIMGTERRTRRRDREWVDGNLYMTPNAALESCRNFNPVIYYDYSFRGGQYPLRRNEGEIISIPYPEILPSSLCIPHNWQVTLHSTKNFQGKQVTLTGPIEYNDLSDVDPDSSGVGNWRSNLASVTVHPPGGEPPPPFCVFPTLFEHDHYQGRTQVITGNIDDLRRMPIGKRASSICVPARFAVNLHKESAMTGDFLRVEGPIEIADLKRDKPGGRDWGDKILSVRYEGPIR